MKILKLTILLAGVALSGCVKDDLDRGSNQTPVPAHEKIIGTSNMAYEGEMLVKFSNEAADRIATSLTRTGATRSGITELDAVLDRIGAVRLERVFVYDEKNEADQRAFGLHRWYMLTFDEEQPLDDVAAQLAAFAEVSHVEFNAQVSRMEPMEEPMPVDALPASPATRADALPFNDKSLGMQWHYINTGSPTIVRPSVAGADINVAPAWEICAGDPSIIVAVVDGPVASDHEDLADNVWTNAFEFSGEKGVDDDGNGFVDDIHGINLSGRSTNLGPISWDNPQEIGHGTHVAGTVAAVNNNGIGVSGVAGGTGKKDGVKILNVQVFVGASNTGLGRVAQGFVYAANQGASILQCSWGRAPFRMSDDDYKRVYSAEYEGIVYFIEKQRPGSPLNGGICIFSAGNDGAACAYPSALAGVISVTSLAADGTPSTFSNYGPPADIAAPGGDMHYYLSQPTEKGNVLSTLTPNQGTYGYMAGTSMSSPHVSGVAALGLSYAKRLGKTFTPEEFKALLLSSVNDLDPYMEEVKTYSPYTTQIGTYLPGMLNLPALKGQYGCGMVDAYKMLMAVRGTPAITVGVGVETEISLAKYYGDVARDPMEYDFVVSDEVREKLGMEITVVDDYTVKIKCTKQNSGLASVAVSFSGNDLEREIAIVCRERVASNGGWL